MTIELVVKSERGNVNRLHVEELISVDGRPYTASEDLRDYVNHLSGRVQAIENVLAIGGNNGSD